MIMKFNPYKILGIDHDATTEEIRAAYRKLCKTLHPDVGGGREEFEELQQAHELLTDTVRRARYDETGITGNDGDQAITVLQDFFIKIISESTIECLEQSNIINTMRQEINKQKNTFITGLNDLKNKRKSQEKTLKIITKRLKTKRKNFLIAALKHSMELLNTPIAEHEKQIAIGEEMLILLDGFEYEFEAPAQSSLVTGSYGIYKGIFPSTFSSLGGI